MTDDEEITARLAHLAQLAPNWDSYDAREMQPGIEARTLTLLRLLRSRPRMSLTPSGGMNLSFGDDEDLMIDLEPDGSVEVCIEDHDLATPRGAATRKAETA